jgi:hypothetical protein
MSMDASGTVAGTVTFAKWKGRNYVRQTVTPANPRSAAQTAVRATFAALVALWKADTANLTAAFDGLAKAKNISAFNAFVGFNQQQASKGFFIANNPAPTGAAPASAPTGANVVVSGKYAVIDWTEPATADVWALAVYRKLGSAPTGIQNELVGVVMDAATSYQDGPLIAGNYFYALASISDEGGRGAIVQAGNVIIP